MKYCFKFICGKNVVVFKVGFYAFNIAAQGLVVKDLGFKSQPQLRCNVLSKHALLVAQCYCTFSAFQRSC